VAAGMGVLDNDTSVAASSKLDKFILFVSWDEVLHRHGLSAMLDILGTRAARQLVYAYNTTYYQPPLRC